VNQIKKKSSNSSPNKQKKEYEDLKKKYVDLQTYCDKAYSEITKLKLVFFLFLNY